MKKIILCVLSVVLVACSSQHHSRDIASGRKSLTGTYLAVAEYESRSGKPDKAAVRTYFHPIKGKADTYSVVILEYVDLHKMAPSYIISNKVPAIANLTGYLKNINDNASVYEAIPGDTANTYKLYPVTVHGSEIIANTAVDPRILTVSKGSNPLAGATISKVKPSEPESIYFPTADKDDKVNHIAYNQYHTAKLAYEKAKLKSTWRKNFLKGPYLSQYYKLDDEVLKLSQKNGKDLAEFKVGKVGKLNEKKRKEMFTNPKSAGLTGTFEVSEPRDGMFVFNQIKSNRKSNAVIEGRIGLFVDIFDATESLGQDVVELIMVNTEEPTDFLMYYEHPGNGEGSLKKR